MFMKIIKPCKIYFIHGKFIEKKPKQQNKQNSNKPPRKNTLNFWRL